LRTLFSSGARPFEPLTLSEFARRYTAGKSAAAGRA